MYIDKKDKRKSIAFEDIREGTVFECDGDYFLRCCKDQAVDLNTGLIITSTSESTRDWSRCYMYPRASLKI